ncbi:MAG: alpha/beta hydrolase [Bacteriovoracia bacterium]
MNLRWLVVYLLCVGICPRLSLATTFDAGVREFEQTRQELSALVSHERHLPVLKTHQRKTPVSVLYFHGLYESPQYAKGIIESFHAQGFNVYAPLLSGHWRKNVSATNRTHFSHWLTDLRSAMSLARKIGERVILAGFSTGGLLALRGALEYPREVTQLVLWAPAVHLSQEAYWAIQYGRLSGLTLNDRLELPYDGYDVTLYSPAIGQQVVDLITDTMAHHSRGLTAGERQRALARRITVPTLLISSELDDTVSFRAQKNFFRALPGPKKHLVFDRTTDILHGNLTKRRDDVFIGWEDRYNFEFDRMIGVKSRFLTQTADQ